MILDFLVVIPVLVFSVILHEVSHGWVAFKLGDPTAKLAGRLTLNPLKHLDLWGSFIIPAVLRSLGLLPIGWAKPVPIDYRNLHNPKKDIIWVALAGPMSNFSLALVLSQVLKLNYYLPEIVLAVVTLGIVINLVLAIFNMIPIPPLDGSRIVLGLLPNKAARYYNQLEPFGIVIVLVLLNFGYLHFMNSWVEFFSQHLGVNLGAVN